MTPMDRQLGELSAPSDLQQLAKDQAQRRAFHALVQVFGVPIDKAIVASESYADQHWREWLTG